MSECERLSDRMPEVAQGRHSWTADEAKHLHGCDECRAEWAVVRAAGNLGARTAASLDAGAHAEALQRRLARHRWERRRRGWALGGLAAAAAVALTVWTGISPPPGEPAPVTATGPAAGALVPLPELDALEPAELDSLLQRMEGPLAGGSTLDAPTLGELETHELERVLATWEG